MRTRLGKFLPFRLVSPVVGYSLASIGIEFRELPPLSRRQLSSPETPTRTQRGIIEFIRWFGVRKNSLCSWPGCPPSVVQIPRFIRSCYTPLVGELFKRCIVQTSPNTPLECELPPWVPKFSLMTTLIGDHQLWNYLAPRSWQRVRVGVTNHHIPIIEDSNCWTNVHCWITLVLEFNRDIILGLNI